jgi:hypothetical protein
MIIKSFKLLGNLFRNATSLCNGHFDELADALERETVQKRGLGGHL